VLPRTELVAQLDREPDARVALQRPRQSLQRGRRDADVDLERLIDRVGERGRVDGEGERAADPPRQRTRAVLGPGRDRRERGEGDQRKGRTRPPSGARRATTGLEAQGFGLRAA